MIVRTIAIEKLLQRLFVFIICFLNYYGDYTDNALTSVVLV